MRDGRRIDNGALANFLPDTENDIDADKVFRFLHELDGLSCQCNNHLVDDPPEGERMSIIIPATTTIDRKCGR